MSKKKIGIIGASSGGTVACTAMLKYPKLFNASVCTSSLLDFERFTKLHKGAAWITEYGDPDNPSERDYLIKNSPLHMINKEMNNKVSKPIYI